MANSASEQIRAEYSIDIAPDQHLTPRQMREEVCASLGEEAKIGSLNGRKVVLYKNNIILTKAITYLGNPHPVFKKRIQIPLWWKEEIYDVFGANQDYEIRYLGVYHYNDLTMFVDFDKSRYVTQKGHNSSAHVYTNDLYQGLTRGIFRKVDANGNTITSIRFNQLKGYLDGTACANDVLLDLFDQFNDSFPFMSWIKAQDAIATMRKQGWNKWKETEWAGWFLEYLFNDFTVKNNVTDQMIYVGNLHKGRNEINEANGIFDFDIWFDSAKFYGDLKASSNSSKDNTPGNDQETFVKCISMYNKFWYVIYGHNTVRDKDCNYQATLFRNQLIKENNPADFKGDYSYKNRMKNRVQFDRMCIIELNRVNFRNALIDFNQGHQPDGKPRKKKFAINKKNIENFIIYRRKYE